MPHPEDEVEKEPEYWTPEAEKAKDPEERLDRLLDKAEQHLENLGAEAARPAAPILEAPVAYGTGMGRSHIELRRISNGFIMTYSRAKPVAGNTALPFPVYNPVLVEVFVSNAAEAQAPLDEAMKAAALLSETFEKIEAFYEKQASAPPTKV